MNIVDAVYLLRMEWIYYKNLVLESNLKYFCLPIMYLTIMLLLIPINPKNTYEINSVSLNSYTTRIFKEDKVTTILEKYNLSQHEFDTIVAIVLSEANDYSYEDSYAVINTIYNRTHSKLWVTLANNKYGNGKGSSMYYQAILPNQFVVYQNGAYLRKLGKTNCVGYDAIIDFLYEGKMLHNYLSFRSNETNVSSYEQFSERGNKYFGELTEQNRI